VPFIGGPHYLVISLNKLWRYSRPFVRGYVFFKRAEPAFGQLPAVKKKYRIEAHSFLHHQEPRSSSRKGGDY
jgi:hypothetical protein